jgi:diguanylate cyclase (GGDEF)-like protein
MGGAILPASRRHRVVRVLESVVVAGLVASVAEPRLRTGLLVAATALCGARPLFVRAERRAWLALSVAMGLLVAGIHPAFYPAAAIGLVLLARDGAEKAKTAEAGPWLDVLTAALAASALAALAGPSAGSLSLIAVAVAAALMALRSWRPGPAWALLGAGVVLFAIVDPPIGVAIMALAAWRPPTKEQPTRRPGRADIVVPTALVGAAITLMVIDHFSPVPTGAMILAAGAVATAIARSLVAAREVRSLADSRRQARTDELTNLGNRRMFYERVETALAGRAAGEALALLLIDLDRFKEINDSLGHQVGDELLRQIGPRLDSAMRPGDVLARLGGDEFALLVGPSSGADATEFAQEIAARIRAAIARPFRLDGVALHIDASVGIAIGPEHGTDANALMQRADVAMYQAKGTRSGCEVYRPDRDHHSRDRLETIDGLRAALDNGELILHYQPKAALATGQIVGAEALVRWQHPTRGLLYPDAFVPLAEQTGLMRPFTTLVLDMALRQVAAWRADGLDLAVAVNLSVTNLLDAELPDQVARLLADLDLPGSALEVEITESILMVDPARSQEVVERLRALGVGLAVDDYGTGYSSLAYLRQLRLDELKLDRCFVMDLGLDPGAAAIVRSTVDLAHSLGLRMVAEGVETEAAWEQLHQFGCDIAQGPFVGRPQPADELTANLHAWLVPLPR